MDGISIKTLSKVLLLGSVLALTFCSRDDEPAWESVAEDLTREINADSIKAHILWLQNMGTRYALADNHREVAVRIRNRFRAMGYETARLDSFWVNITRDGIPFEGWQYNVEASLTGYLHPDSLCILGGHYDDMSQPEYRFTNAPGANDNASGVSAALEIARVMKKKGYLPANTVRFIAFGAEELGLLGSADYAAGAKQAGDKIVLMLNNDMIAYDPGNNNSLWKVNILDYDNSHSLRSEAEKICNIFTELGYVNDNKYNKASDSYPFFTNGYKPLFFFSYMFDANYHTINDIAANCDFEYCREVTKISCAMLVRKSWGPGQ